MSQTHRQLELIIVDDCSTDNSLEIIQGFLTDERIKLFVNSNNRGANYSRNIGIHSATGKYLLFIDADDVLTPTCVAQRLVKAQQHADGNLFVFGMGVFCKRVGDDKRQWIPLSRNPLNDFLQHTLPWSILQPLWLTAFIKSLNGFDESFQRLQDVEIHTRALLHPGIQLFQFPDQVDCYYRIDDSRKNFTPYVFLERWMQAAAKYCNKFETLVPAEKAPFLFGTLLKAQQQLAVSFRQGQINQKELKNLENTLFSVGIYQRASLFKRGLIAFASAYTLYLPRIPGVNKLLSKLAVL